MYLMDRMDVICHLIHHSQEVDRRYVCFFDRSGIDLSIVSLLKNFRITLIYIHTIHGKIVVLVLLRSTEKHVERFTSVRSVTIP